MRTLMLLRHGKSSHKDSRLADFDRPLTKRGRRDASRIGALLVDEDMLPDLIVSSTACRARETTERLVAAAGFDGPVHLTDDLYMASSRQIVKVIAAQPAARMAMMIVGHNPGLEELMTSLTNCEDPLPTASLTGIVLPIKRWRDLKSSTAGKLVQIWRPKELD